MKRLRSRKKKLDYKKKIGTRRIHINDLFKHALKLYLLITQSQTTNKHHITSHQAETHQIKFRKFNE